MPHQRSLPKQTQSMQLQRNVQTPIQMKLYVSLRKRQDDGSDYKKLVLMISE